MTWTITWNGHTWTEDDLLACDAATVQSLTQGTWRDVDPWLGPMQLMAMIAALEARASDREPLDVLAELRSLPVGDLIGIISPRSPSSVAA